MVVIYTLLTGPTLPWVARVLGVAHREEPRDLEVEAAPLERIAADLLQVNITRKSRLHGVEVGELRLPAGVSVSLIVRDGHTWCPTGGPCCGAVTTSSWSRPASCARRPRSGCGRCRGRAASRSGGPTAEPCPRLRRQS